MDYNDLRVFVRTVEAGSFTGAARTLGVQKSSVSRSVARLEGDLGVRLLQRTTRRFVLTDAGEALFGRVRNAVDGLDEAATVVSELGSEPRGVIRVAAPADAHMFGIAEMVTRFVQRYPSIQVTLELGTRAVDLVGEGFDLAVRAGRLKDSSLIIRRIGSTNVALFASPDYLRTRGRPKTLADLSRHDGVLFRARGDRAVWNLEGPNGEEAVEVKGRISADEMFFVARTLVAGAGIGLLPAILARDFVVRGDLETVLPAYRFAGADLFVVLPSSAFLPSRVALLRDFLVDDISRELHAAREECSRDASKRRHAK